MAHILSSVLSLDASNVKRPGIVVIVCDAQPRVVRDHVLVYSEDRLRVRFDPRYLSREHPRSAKINAQSVHVENNNVSTLIYKALHSCINYPLHDILFINDEDFKRTSLITSECFPRGSHDNDSRAGNTILLRAPRKMLSEFLITFSSGRRYEAGCGRTENALVSSALPKASTSQ